MEQITACDMSNKDWLEQQIVSACDSISKFKLFTDAVRNCGQKGVVSYLVEWHRKNVFDYLSCLLQVPEQELSNNFFICVFGVFLTYLEICDHQDVGVVIDAVEKCYKIAGRDFASGLALEKLESYLGRYPEDIDVAMLHYENTAPYGKGRPFVWMEALKSKGELYWKKFFSWIDNAKNDDENVIALQALTMIPTSLNDVSSIMNEAIKRIVKMHEVYQSDEIKGALYRATEAWCGIVDRQNNDVLVNITNALLADGSLNVLYFATMSSAFSVKQQSQDVIDYRLSIFLNIDPKQTELVNNLSLYLQKLLPICPERVFSFIEDYTVKHSCSITIFDGVIDSIAKCDELLRNQYFTRWLESDSICVARNVYEIASHLQPEKSLNIQVVFAAHEQCSDERLLVLFLRAIGWLYLFPETCVGFLVSCAQKMGISVLKSVFHDFFYLIVLNYLSEYKQALKQLPSHERRMPYYKYLKKLELFADQWWGKLSTAGECRELFPSVRHKELHSKRLAGLFAKATKDARANSILSHIARNVDILHGRGWIVSTQTAEGEQMQESLLQHISSSFRISRLSEIASHTLEIRLSELRYFRREMIIS